MQLKKISEDIIANKKILLRVDFNVAVKDGKLQEQYKIKACRETLEYLLKNNCQVALASHLGRPEGKVNPEFSFEKITGEIAGILGKDLVFVSDCVGEKVKVALDNLPAGKVILLENLRFYPGEEKNDEEFAKMLAENFDIYVNEAFSVCHRDQASVTGITKFLPHAAGFWLEKEVENLSKAKDDPEHPATAIIGGAKIETKLPLIEKFEKSYDHILVGGKIACEAKDQNLKLSSRVIFPEDFATDCLDIGPNAIEKFIEIINQSKSIVWNGPLGFFEKPPFDLGTRKILEAIINSQAYSVAGGGETVQVLEEKEMLEKFSFVSTGGGAMLEFLSGGPMPGIKVLKA
jgi:phosphoglycerate kinase